MPTIDNLPSGTLDAQDDLLVGYDSVTGVAIKVPVSSLFTTILYWVRTSEYTSLNLAVAAAAAANTLIVVDNEIIQTANLVVPIVGLIDNAGYTLAINGPFTAPITYIFKGTGAVSFGVGVVPYVVPEWGGETDTTSMQWAIDVSKASGDIPIGINRKYTLIGPIYINRTVDTNLNELRIIGTGPDAGLYTASAIWMFASTTAHTVSPVSEFITFEGIRFEASDDDLAAWVMMGDKFLRVKYLNCTFIKIRCAATGNYFQSWRFDQCNVRGIKGIFMDAQATGAFSDPGLVTDFHVTNTTFEASSADGNGVCTFLKAASNITGSSFTDNVSESHPNPFIETTAGFLGGIISGNYFEGTTVNPALKLGATAGLSITGNYFNMSTDAAYYAVDLETSISVVSSGNFSAGNLYDDSSVIISNGGDGLVSHGDWVSGGRNLYYNLADNHGVIMGSLVGNTVAGGVFVTYHRSANTVTVSWTDQSGTSNSTGMSITGLPARLLPAADRIFLARIIDNGTAGFGLVSIGPTGVVFSNGISGGVFTASGTKGVLNGTVTYSLGE